MPEPGKQHRDVVRHGVWFALFALVIQFGLPLAHYCSLEPGNHSCVTERLGGACNASLPSGQTLLQEAPCAPASEHDHSSCPVCCSLQRPVVAESPTSHVWAVIWLATGNSPTCHHVSVFSEAEWSTFSPRGPPRNS